MKRTSSGGPVPKVLDFTVGSRWGRALHSAGMHSVEPKTRRERFTDWCQSAVRYSVMCHYPECPQVGDTVVWEAAKHFIRAEIIHVKPCYDPRDMYTLTVRVTPDCRIKK